MTQSSKTRRFRKLVHGKSRSVLVRFSGLEAGKLEAYEYATKKPLDVLLKESIFFVIGEIERRMRAQQEQEKMKRDLAEQVDAGKLATEPKLDEAK